MEVIIALGLGVLLGVVVVSFFKGSTLPIRLKAFSGRLTLPLTYILVCMIGLRVAEVLPEVFSRGSQALLIATALSAIPTLASLVLTYLLIRG